MLVNRAIVLRALNMGERLAPLMNRATGKSTATALECIARAIRDPGKPIQVRDHYDSCYSHRRLLEDVAGMVDKLGLEGFTFRDGAVTCNFAERIA